MVIVASIIVLIFALWLTSVSLYALWKPQRAVANISAFASTNFIHYLELSLRGIVGIAFVISASHSSAPRIFGIVGWGLFVSAIIIVAVPRKWHASYAQYWSVHIPPKFVYVFAPISILVGMYLLAQFSPVAFG